MIMKKQSRLIEIYQTLKEYYMKVTQKQLKMIQQLKMAPSITKVNNSDKLCKVLLRTFKNKIKI